MLDFLNNREVSNNFRDFAIPLTFLFCFFFGGVMLYLKPRNVVDWCWTWVVWSFVFVIFGGIFRNNGNPLPPYLEIAIWTNVIVCMVVTSICYIKWQIDNREF